MAQAEAVFEPQDLLFVFFSVQYFLADRPPEAYYLPKPANFRASQLHLPVEDKVYVGLGRLKLSVDGSIGLDLEQIPILKDVFESAYRQ